MATFTDVSGLIPTLCGRLVEGAGVELAQASVMLMTDADVVRVLEETSALARQVEQIQVVAAGVIALRSKRERGHSGLAATRGHKSAASLVQDVTGSTKADAHRKVRVGEALFEESEPEHEAPSSGGGPSGDGLAGDESSGDGPSGDARPDDEPSGGEWLGHEPSGGATSSEGQADDGQSGDGQSHDGQLHGEPSEGGRAAPGPWHQPLKDALGDGRLTSSQFDAIRRGLGEPPSLDSDQLDSDGLDAGAQAQAQAREEARAAWAQAAEHLIVEAAERTVEELWQQARMIRDLLDPEGAEERFLARHEKRSFRTYRGQDGQKRASIAFDDEGELFIETLFAAGLRPRRGGPRFVDADEKEQAADLAADPRTNDQLAYDLFLDVMRAGALADAESVFGTRQAGVRLVQVVDADGNTAPVAHSEDHLASMPGTVAEQHICDSGFVPVTVDSGGNPLNMGRDQRLFTSKQRIALAIRDGGCRWHGCDRPASYCEAHHIDPYSQGGRTDIDRGIMLCRYHHMTLHHGRWWITRRGTDEFVLHHPSGETFAMRSRSALSYAWGGIAPPPKRFRPAA